MKLKYLALLLLSCSLFAQEPARPFPHPFAEAAVNLNGGGYYPIGASGATGIDLETKHFISQVFVRYATAKKSDDGTVGNTKGHQNTVSGEAYYRLSNGFFFGGGYGHTQLSTTNYSKAHDFWRAGGGIDFIGPEHSVRFQGALLKARNERVVYPDGTSCTADYCTNDIKGFDVNIWYPSPSQNKHVFLHSWYEAIMFHNYGQTSHAVGSFLSVGVVYRF